MESLEFNKIAAGILVAVLLAVGIGKIGNVLYAPELPEHAAVETEGDAHSNADVGGSDHGDMAADVALPVLLANADLADGEKQFNKCKSCHTIENGGSNGVGPNLWGIVGASKEHAQGYAYSGALAAVGGDWSFESLDAYITDPKGYAPGTKMTFRGISDNEDRANLIAWMNEQSNDPLPLPEVEEVADDDGADNSQGEMNNASGDDSGLADDANTPSRVKAMIAAAPVEDGENVAKKCRACHTFDEGGANRVGPNLWDVVDRDIAGVPDFSYSSAMEEEGGTWTYDRLWAYLADPKNDIPGNKMSFRGITDEDDLAALIAYLRSLSNDPAPLAGVQ